MSDLPKVTIMIPTYNQSEYILQAIDSALSQSYENIEIVVSDDSTDSKTCKLLSPYIETGKILYRRNVPSFGRVGNYYDTLRCFSSGDWILNLDGDDFYINTEFIKNAIQVILENPKVVMIFGKEKSYFEDTNSFSPRETGLVKSQFFDGRDIFLNKSKRGVSFYHLSTIYHRESAIKADFYTDECLGADTNSLMRLIYGNRVYFLNEYCGAWRVHMENDTFTTSIDTLINNIECLKRQFEFLLLQGESKYIASKWYRDTAVNRLGGYVISLVNRKQYVIAIRLLLNYFSAAGIKQLGYRGFLKSWLKLAYPLYNKSLK